MFAIRNKNSIELELNESIFQIHVQSLELGGVTVVDVTVDVVVLVSVLVNVVVDVSV